MKIIRLTLQLYGLTVFQKIVGHVLPSWSKMASKFLKITNYHIRVEVSGKRVNHGVEVGLEIPLNYLNYFYGDTRVITLVKNSLEKLVNELHIKVNNCVN